MATAESLGQGTMRAIPEFGEVAGIRSRNERLEAIRTGADRFRQRFGAEGTVHGLRMLDLSRTAYPARQAFGGAARAGLTPWVTVAHRLVVVQFEDFDGVSRVLCWRPLTSQAAIGAPFEAGLARRHGAALSRRLLYANPRSLREALARCGLAPSDVDLVAFDHLRGQDMRTLMGTTRPVDGEPEPRGALFGRARFLLRESEVKTLRTPHPSQAAWYVPRGMDDVIEERAATVDGDVELGVGVALVTAPGLSEGSQSLVVNTPDGVTVFSGNGFAADNWHPHLSKIPGVAKEAQLMRREVILEGGTLDDAADQYDSMVKEKCVSDPSRTDPRWMNVIPSSEIPNLRRLWPMVPSFSHGRVSHGTIQAFSRNGN